MLFHPLRKTRQAFLALTLVSLVGTQTTQALTPESPEVKSIVERAATFLEDTDAYKDKMLHNSDFGGQCLIALALFKAGRAPDHAKIQQALELCRAEAAKEQIVSGQQPSRTYAHAIALILMCEIDQYVYAEQIQTMASALERWQQEPGGWGYSGKPRADVSQTQYCVLGLWLARKHGAKVQDETFVKACKYLLRVQNPGGNWPYQSKDPGTDDGRRIAQESFSDKEEALRTSPSMAAAGLGTLYICIDALGLRSPFQNKSAADEGPIKRVERPEEKKQFDVSEKFLVRAINDGNGWMSNNFTAEPDQRAKHYFRYAFERYASFRELVEENTQEEPPWYDAFVNVIREKQLDTGGFEPGAGDEGVATSLVILTLTRSTKKSIDNIYGDGLLVGGKGLPTDVSNLRQDKEGKVVTALDQNVLQISELAEEFSDLDEAGMPVLSDNASVRGQQFEKLKSLVAGESFEKRQAAVQVLAKVGELRNVPVLIFALSDPDPRVVRSARDGLRFISRRLDGFGLPDRPGDPKNEDAAELWKEQVQEAQAAWLQWFRSVQPDADLEFIQFD